MSGKFMNVKRIIIPTLTMIIITSQLMGCASVSQDEALNLLRQGDQIEIEIATPKDTVKEEKDTLKVREELLKLSGVGPKVADCILLFSELKRFDVFPIDVWVRRVMNDLYIKEENEEKVSKKKIENLAKEKFGNLSGIAQQYLFYWRREA